MTAYSDPTANKAIKHIMAEQDKQAWKERVRADIVDIQAYAGAKGYHIFGRLLDEERVWSMRF